MQFINKYFNNDCLLCDSRTEHNAKLLCDLCMSDLDLYPLGSDLLYSYSSISSHIIHDAITGIAVVSNYQWPFEQWIPQMKFHNHINSAKLMGQMLNEHLANSLWPTIDLITPMPIHSQRLLQRGYNQAELLCKFINYSSHSTLFHGLTRTKYTQPQTELNKIERKQNMKQAFACENTVQGKTVLLVDDVITTGHTANAAAQELLNSGATAVYLVAVAIRKYN
ncbi:hypothetical protein GCM10008107_30510 [Psychrosphaera saromensis]|nr:phosphoribosyltransferase family protein [Psychrosphaera saromensis]GHB78862.1 hypothetical protein GCM10008107_30510 [Psychrosphaera saromensis]GLQ14655.1 hypothetical protein GCM10007917_21100 [Psychrosphaera saromensis]